MADPTQPAPEPEAVSLEWEGNGKAVMLVVSPDGGAGYSVRKSGAFYRVLNDFSLPHELASAIRECANG